MRTAKVDTSGLRAKLKRIDACSGGAALQAVKLIAEDAVNAMVQASPRDTNRYVRGWAEAGNAAGVGAWTVPAIEPSRGAERLRDRLEQQVGDYKRRLEDAQKRAKFWRDLHTTRYLAVGRHDRHERDLLRKLAASDKSVTALAKRLEEAQQQVQNYSATGLVIWGRKTKNETAKGRLATVRQQVYGGTGAIRILRGHPVVELHNREPHASIVEKTHRVVARAMARGRAAGLRRAKAAFIRELRKAG